MSFCAPSHVSTCCNQFNPSVVFFSLFYLSIQTVPLVGVPTGATVLEDTEEHLNIAVLNNKVAFFSFFKLHECLRLNLYGGGVLAIAV